MLETVRPFAFGPQANCKGFWLCYPGPMTELAQLSFFARLWLAFLCFWRVLVSRPFAQAVHPLSQAYDAGTLAAGTPAPAS